MGMKEHGKGRDPVPITVVIPGATAGWHPAIEKAPPLGGAFPSPWPDAYIHFQRAYAAILYPYCTGACLRAGAL